MIIVETTPFTKLIKTLMSDDEYRELQVALVVRPDLGDIVPGVVAFEKFVGACRAKASAAVFASFITGLSMMIIFECCTCTPREARQI